ncbi:glycine cleavage system aminomethyltransferase GcvT [Pseudonocardiaceae bacterium YIM PH 21723]|nr:glycine cleavage system aminomethyltransferase GcvT [Pseudonocardiaceae bacterium YIM PH 21723]
MAAPGHCARPAPAWRFPCSCACACPAGRCCRWWPWWVAPPRRSACTPGSVVTAARPRQVTCPSVTQTPGNDALLTSPLHEAHEALGPTWAPFGGWQMPIQYSGGGVVAEHTAVREAVGIFDVSHLGKALVTGPGAAAFVNSCLTADLGKIAPGKAQYTLCCAENGGVVDDLIAYLVSEDEVFLVPNAANTAEVVRLLQAAAPEGITVTGQHRDYAVIAVQGPKSGDVLDKLGLPSDMEYMAYADADWNGYTVRVCRTGYTGEHGYELLPKWDEARALWDALAEAAASFGGRPAGLGARDTLRTEMGYPLHGHDLSLEISPVQAGSTWAVGWKKDAFWGRDALTAEKANGPKRRLRGLRAVERGVPREQMDVLNAAGEKIGETTSGTFSPTLKTGIALALIDTEAGVELGDQVTLEVRGRKLACEVVKPPFVDTKTK